MEAIKTYLTEKGKVKIYYDSDPENPRNWDTVVTLHTRNGCPYFENESKYETYSDLIKHYQVEQSGYDSEAMYRDIDSLIAAAESQGDILKPISVYEHSGSSLYVGTPRDHFDGEWDCSLLGFGIMERKTIEQNWNSDLETANKCFDGEIVLLSQYISGDVYRYVLCDPETDEEIDSCSGFYGYDVNENGISDYVGKEIAIEGRQICHL